MSQQQRDPVFESLNRLAGLADDDLVGDRLPAIERRVRTARRRKVMGAGAAVAVLAVGAVATWQLLPGSTPVPPADQPESWQRITIDAKGVSPDQLRISFTVTGRSTTYVDRSTGRAVDFAGPQSTEVLVDGKAVSMPDSASVWGDLACEPGGTPTSYTLTFPTDGPFTVPVSSSGEHTIVVNAPYCDDGTLHESTQSIVVSSPDVYYTTADRLKADLDGDGVKEVVEVLEPAQGSQAWLLQVTWGTGEVSSAPLSAMTWGLVPPVDLDQDGRLEVLVHGGGGEYGEGRVFRAGPDALTQVETVDARGNPTGLLSGDPAGWQTDLGAEEIRSYRLVDPNTTDSPAPVEVRTWSLDGNTLTQSAESTQQCVVFQPTFSLGPC